MYVLRILIDADQAVSCYFYVNHADMATQKVSMKVTPWCPCAKKAKLT